MLQVSSKVYVDHMKSSIMSLSLFTLYLELGISGGT